MSLAIVLAALIWAHFHPHKAVFPERMARQWHTWLLDSFNAGQRHQGMLAWGAGVLLPALGIGLFASLLGQVWTTLGWFFELVVLYYLLGFRAASFHAASIARALTHSDLEKARALLRNWHPDTLPGGDAESLSCITVEETLKAALSTLFGVLFWYLLFGVTGIVAYRLAYLCRDIWQGQDEFDRFAVLACQVLDWLPARMTAFSFAIVGNFQDALESWRGQAHTWGDENQGILLSAAAGALGIRLGGNLALAGGELLRPTLGLEEAPDSDSIAGVIALVWRATVLWLAIAGLFWLGSV